MRGDCQTGETAPKTLTRAARLKPPIAAPLLRASWLFASTRVVSTAIAAKLWERQGHRVAGRLASADLVALDAARSSIALISSGQESGNQSSPGPKVGPTLHADCPMPLSGRRPARRILTRDGRREPKGSKIDGGPV
ncbi:MAG: hypothetical protein QOJ81_2150 [Chloroflexota bacterium]|jgi:hypothetical protein|nr:hypothetical protein [Chloroflexota bacterium]